MSADNPQTAKQYFIYNSKIYDYLLRNSFWRAVIKYKYNAAINKITCMGDYKENKWLHT